MKKAERRRLREQVKEFLALGKEWVGVLPRWHRTISPFDFTAKRFNGYQVYVIEKRAVFIDSVHGHCASGGFVYRKDGWLLGLKRRTTLPTKIVYVPGAYGFGKTVREAWQAARDRAWRRMPLEVRIAEVKEQYPSLSSTATWQEWGDVHAMITGSCEKGRQEWIKQRGPEVRVTMEEFLRATESDYGNENIKKLKEAYEN